ncbi:MAG: DNA-3-methyladenine glycosylase 2 family protein [Bacteroidota bacterium]
MAAILASTATFNSQNFHYYCDLLAARESMFATIIRNHGYPPFWSRQQGFETLIHIILEQQVSLASALAAYSKLKQKLLVITPASLLSLSDEDLKNCYFSRQKIIYTKHLASCIISGKIVIEDLENKSNETIALHLQQVKGIGKWTSDVYLMMALHRTDCFPIGDIALINSMKYELQLDKLSTSEILLDRAEKWRPYRTIAAYLLWHAYLQRRIKVK